MNRTSQTTKSTKRTCRKSPLRTRILSVFAAAHAEGRATMGHEEFLMSASVAGLSARDIGDAIADEILRRGMTGFWMKEAADPGALLIFASALRAPVEAEEV